MNNENIKKENNYRKYTSNSMYNYKYDLEVSGNTAIKAVPIKGASLVSKSVINLKKGENTVTLSVKSETGYTNKYTISVNATKDCKIYITSDGSLPEGGSSSSDDTESEVVPEITLGDTNNDGTIDILDLARVQMHILNLKKMTDEYLTAADTNKDGKVDIVDLAKVQMHILKIKPIKQ